MKKLIIIAAIAAFIGLLASPAIMASASCCASKACDCGAKECLKEGKCSCKECPADKCSCEKCKSKDGKFACKAKCDCKCDACKDGCKCAEKKCGDAKCACDAKCTKAKSCGIKAEGKKTGCKMK